MTAGQPEQQSRLQEQEHNFVGLAEVEEVHMGLVEVEQEWVCMHRTKQVCLAVEERRVDRALESERVGCKVVAVVHTWIASKRLCEPS